MKILNIPIKNFTFQDVVSFCQEGLPEGFQIDYKEELPSKGLAKHFAAFSNSRGGVILVGIEEDKKTGLPKTWLGIDDDAKTVERVYQIAANIDPRPSIEVHKTDAVKGKAFILIRIYEGDKTPYYVQTDPNIWVRTGTISKSIDIASPDAVELFFNKRQNAEKARNNYLRIADEVYKSGLAREEKKRQKLIADAKAIEEGSENRYCKNPLGTNVNMCTITLQPYFPSKAIANPPDIKAKRDNFTVQKGYSDFPDLNMEAIPQGIMHFKHNSDGYIECQQIYSQGLFYNSLDVMRTDEKGTRIIYLSYLLGRVFIIHKSAIMFYNLFGYQGVLKGTMTLDVPEESYIRKLQPQGFSWFNEDKERLLHRYIWSIETDTQTLNTPTEFEKYYYDFVREVYWSLGFEDVSDEVIRAFLKQNNLSLL